MIDKDKVLCAECNWRGHLKDVLTALNPFDLEDEIVGCPRCKSVNSISGVCDEMGCEEIDTCGFPTPEGYRRTCGKHYRQYNP